METVFERTSMVSDIVTKLPQASDVFKKYKIDFCCGGHRPLYLAVQERGLDESEVLNTLHELYEQKKAQNEMTVNWTEASYSELINHIMQKHHAFLYNELPALSQFVTKIFRVHGHSHPELEELHSLFHTLKPELEKHTVKEEQEAFPLIKQYEEDQSSDSLQKAQSYLQSLEDEHEGAGDVLKKIREVTNDYTLPEGACMSYQLTFQRLEALESDMFEHIHLENNILFQKLMKESA